MRNVGKTVMSIFSEIFRNFPKLHEIYISQVALCLWAIETALRSAKHDFISLIHCLFVSLQPALP
jgi:hypothetical protein